MMSDAFLGKAWKTASDMVITLPIPFASIYALDTAVLEGFTRARWYHGRLKDFKKHKSKSTTTAFKWRPEEV